MKFLIDEGLSAELTKAALDRGHAGSSHVRWIGKAGVKDWNLLPLILEGDWTFVTRNAYDFRGPAEAPGAKGEYRKAELHAGLVCLDAPVGFDLVQQLELFEIALDDLDVTACRRPGPGRRPRRSDPARRAAPPQRLSQVGAGSRGGSPRPAARGRRR